MYFTFLCVVMPFKLDNHFPIAQKVITPFTIDLNSGVDPKISGYWLHDNKAYNKSMGEDFNFKCVLPKDNIGSITTGLICLSIIGSALVFYGVRLR